jgi:Zn-dependent protease with chaperone function
VANYAGQVIDRLLAGWPGTKPAIRFFLVPDGHFTSEATAEGGVFLTTGTLAYLAATPELRTEDHLAFILAHELSHILLGHTRDRVAVQELMRRVSGVVAVGSVIAAGSTAANVAKSAKWAVAANFGFAATSDQAAFPSWSRNQERVADVLAVDLMAKAGYAVDAASQVIDVVEQDEARATKEAEAARAALVQDTTNGVSIQTGAALKRLWDSMGNTHPAATDRNGDLRPYIEREYGDQVVRKHRAEFERFLAGPDVRALMAESQALDDARALIVGGRAAAALPKLLSLRRSSIAGSAAADLALARAQDAVGHGPAAMAALQAAASGPYATLSAQLLMGQVLESRGKSEEALRVYQEAQERFDEPSVLPYRIRVLHHLGRKSEETLLSRPLLRDRPD